MVPRHPEPYRHTSPECWWGEGQGTCGTGIHGETSHFFSSPLFLYIHLDILFEWCHRVKMYTCGWNCIGRPDIREYIDAVMVCGSKLVVWTSVNKHLLLTWGKIMWFSFRFGHIFIDWVGFNTKLWKNEAPQGCVLLTWIQSHLLKYNGRVFQFINLRREYLMQAGNRNLCYHCFTVDAPRSTLMHVGGAFLVQN